MEYTTIYALIDPRTSEVRYIGKADNPEERLTHHLTPKNLKYNTYKNHWLNELLSLGLKPTLKPFAKISKSQWQEAEISLIAAARKRGWNLTNGTDGGDGYKGGSFPKEGKKKISFKLKGIKPSEKSIEKMSKSKFGKKRNGGKNNYVSVYYDSKYVAKWMVKFCINKYSFYLGHFLPKKKHMKLIFRHG